MYWYWIEWSALAAVLAVVSTFDLLRRRVPNGILITLTVVGVAVQMRHGFSDLGDAGLAFVLTLGVGLLPWKRGWMGGADLKLLAACAVWIGLARLGSFVLVASALGGVLALGCWALSSREARAQIGANLVRMRPQLARAGGGRVSVPYTLTISLAALLVYGRDIL